MLSSAGLLFRSLWTVGTYFDRGSVTGRGAAGYKQGSAHGLTSIALHPPIHCLTIWFENCISRVNMPSRNKIAGFETFLANAGLRNYLFVRLQTESGHTGIGEATLEWQEKTVQTILHEWVEGRVLGRDPFDIESLIGGMIRDQYQGGSTIMTAISGVEIACWDLMGKICGQPVYRLLGGRCHERIPMYANGWYGGARTPPEFAERAVAAVAKGYWCSSSIRLARPGSRSTRPRLMRRWRSWRPCATLSGPMSA